MKLFFSDIDGTFQDLGQEIPEVNREAVKKVQETGNRFVFVTGRSLEMVEEMMAAEGIACDIIYGNGAGLKRQGELAKLRHPLTSMHTQLIIEYLAQSGVFYFVHTTQGVYSPDPQLYTAQFQQLEQKLRQDLGALGEKIYTFKSAYFFEECQVVTDWAAFLADDTKQIIKVELMDGDDQRIEQLVADFPLAEVTIFQSYVQTLEIVHPLSVKGAAIQEYLADFPDSLSYGIGDGDNDRSMFEVVDVAVAVGNASEAIQAMCDRTIGTSLSGGVGHFILAELAEAH